MWLSWSNARLYEVSVWSDSEMDSASRYLISNKTHIKIDLICSYCLLGNLNYNFHVLVDVLFQIL